MSHAVSSAAVLRSATYQRIATEFTAKTTAKPQRPVTAVHHDRSVVPVDTGRRATVQQPVPKSAQIAGKGVVPDARNHAVTIGAPAGPSLPVASTAVREYGAFKTDGAQDSVRNKKPVPRPQTAGGPITPSPVIFESRLPSSRNPLTGAVTPVRERRVTAAAPGRPDSGLFQSPARPEKRVATARNPLAWEETSRVPFQRTNARPQGSVIAPRPMTPRAVEVVPYASKRDPITARNVPSSDFPPGGKQQFPQQSAPPRGTGRAQAEFSRLGTGTANLLNWNV